MSPSKQLFRIGRYVAATTLALAISGCVEPEVVGINSELCEQAARHQETCSGEYTTPPVCDGVAQSQAEAVIAMDCQALKLSAQNEKADNPFCNWFGISCADDEPFFASGASCSSDSQCGSGYCVESHCFGGFQSRDWDAILDKWAPSVSINGNAISYQPVNDTIRRKRLEMINSAKKSVHMLTLIIENNDSGWAETNALIAAAKRGLDVRVIVDDASQISPYGSVKILQALGAGGVKTLTWNPLLGWGLVRIGKDWDYNNRIHEKILIADGKVSVVGGRNVGDDYLATGHWRDSDVLMTGPAVKELERVFLRDWDEFSALEKASGCLAKPYGIYCASANEPSQLARLTEFSNPTATGSADARVIHSNPRVQSKAYGWMAYLALIRGAKRNITIENAYFIPPKRLRNALKDAVKRGVRVDVVTNSRTSNDVRSMWYASANFYEELIKGGVHIYEWSGVQTIHAKTMVVDDTVAAVGSFNLDPRSADTNSEVIVLTRDQSVVRSMMEQFRQDLSNTTVASYTFSAADKALMAVHRIAEPFF